MQETKKAAVQTYKCSKVGKSYFYASRLSGNPVCEYILATHQRRGCPAEACDKYRRKAGGAGEEAEMYQQLDVFSFLQTEKEEKGAYCWDSDINEIHGMLLLLAEKQGIEISQDEFSVWSHVPQYGYRMWLGMEATKSVLQDAHFSEEVQEITKFAAQRNVELSCMSGACFFYQGENTATLPFCTTFMDGERRKIRDVKK